MVNEDQAKELAKKLANNPAFQVKGGLITRSSPRAARSTRKRSTKKQQEMNEREQKAQQERAQQQQQPPANWKGPEQPELEHQQAERRRVK